MQNELTDFSPDNLSTIMNDEWGLGISPNEISLPQQMGWQSHVVRARKMFIKFLKNPSADRLKLFQREIGGLQDIEGKDLGVEVPRILLAGRKPPMFAMSEVEGMTLASTVTQNSLVSDTVIDQLAHFHIAFDKVMSSCSTLPKDERQMGVWGAQHFDKLPDYAKALIPLLEAANVEITARPAFPLRFVHGDLNPSNIIVTPKGRLGIIDFGFAKHCDPHYPLSEFFAYYGFGFKGCFKLIDSINAKSETGPWLDRKRVVNLSPAKLMGWVAH